MDVIALHQAGFDSAVASLGTALTDSQARLISKYAAEAVIVYDSDEAGVRAANRAIGILEKTGVAVKVLHLSGAKDPDEFIKKFGAEVFRTRLDRSENHIEYRLGNAEAKYTLENDEERVAYLREAAGILAEVRNPVERAVYTERAARTGGVGAEVLTREVEILLKSRRRTEKKRADRKALAPAQAVQPGKRDLRYENVRSAMAEEGLLALLVRDEEMIPPVEGRIGPEDFSSGLLADIYRELLRRASAGQSVEPAALAAGLGEDAMERLTKILLRPAPEADSALDDYIEVILTERKRREGSADALLEIRDIYREKKGYGG